MEILQGNTMENGGKQNPKMGFKPPPEHIVRIHTTYKWLKFKHLRHDSFYVKNVIHIFVLTMRRPWNHFRSRQIAIESRFGLAVAYAHRCRKRIAIAAIMPKGTRMKSAIRMPIATPLASGLRPGGTATSRVSHSSSFMVSNHRGEAREGSAVGQPFTYELFDALRPSEFERRGSWFAESSEPPNERFCSIFWHPEL